MTVSVEVSTPRDRDSDEVVQLYTRQQRSRVKQPLRQLRGFDRVRVPAGGSGPPSTSELRAADLSFWDVISERHVVETARHDLLVGRSAVDIRLTGTLEVDGEVITQRNLHRPIAAINADAYADVQFVDATKLTG